MSKYMIVDDEHMAHEIIKDYCDLLPGLSLAYQCYDALEALEYLRKHSVDLIFLDLNMPKLKGFDFLRTLPRAPKIIVTTAYQEYALEGYELEISDYLLKPFSFERFLKAVNRAVAEEKTQIVNSVDNSEQHIFLYEGKKHVQVKVNEICYVEAAGNYCKVVLTGESVMVRIKISDLLAKLPAGKFMQVHKSFLIAKDKVKSVEGNRILLANQLIPIGQLYKNQVNNFVKP